MQTKGVVQWLRGPNFELFWPPHTYSGQTWTFHEPPTFCPCGQFKKKSPWFLLWYKNSFTVSTFKFILLIKKFLFDRIYQTKFFKKNQRQWFLPYQLVYHIGSCHYEGGYIIHKYMTWCQPYVIHVKRLLRVHT